MAAGDSPQDKPADQFLEQLAPELERWRRERLISARQVARILARYGLRAEAIDIGWRLGRLVSIFAVFGAILVGVGVIVFIASNRQDFELSRGVKVGLMVGSVIFVYLVGYLVRYESRFSTLGDAVIFLGTMLYGAAVFLIGQVYNIQANDPSLPFYWFLGVVPLAYLTRYNPILVMTLLVLGVALGSQAAFWLEDTHSWSIAAVRTIAVFPMLGVLLYFLAPLHERFEPLKGMRWPLQIVGLIAVLGGLYMLGFRVWFEDFVDWEAPDLPASLLQTYGVLAGLAVAAALIALCLWRRTLRALPYEVATALLLLGLMFMVVYVPFDEPGAYVVLFNAVLLATAIGAIGLGLARRQESYVNIGIAFFAIQVVTRYFDLTWELSERSLFFIGAGVIILGWAFLLDLYRRRIVGRLREG
jgi:uncharacterized membrane protein